MVFPTWWHSVLLSRRLFSSHRGERSKCASRGELNFVPVSVSSYLGTSARLPPSIRRINLNFPSSPRRLTFPTHSQTCCLPHRWTRLRWSWSSPSSVLPPSHTAYILPHTAESKFSLIYCKQNQSVVTLFKPPCLKILYVMIMCKSET